MPLPARSITKQHTMSRRRKKNTLLPKMIALAVVINAVLLPLLAHFGAFKAMRGQRLTPVRLVSLPPPPKRPAPPKKAPAKKRAAKATRPQAHVAARPATARASRPNSSQPKVVASSSSGGSGGPTIDNSGTAAPGQLPAAPPQAALPPAPIVPPPPAPTPPPALVAPRPAPPAAAPLAPPVVVVAVPLSQPRPQVPDDLSIDDIHSDFEAQFHIGSDGTVTAQTAQSTGNAVLDRLALDAASHWTFRPATVGGRPVDSIRRLRIQFYAL